MKSQAHRVSGRAAASSDSLAVDFLGAAAIVAIFLFFFVLVPVWTA